MNKYEDLKMELIQFDNEDIVTDSFGDGTPWGDGQPIGGGSGNN